MAIWMSYLILLMQSKKGNDMAITRFLGNTTVRYDESTLNLDFQKEGTKVINPVTKIKLSKLKNWFSEEFIVTIREYLISRVEKGIKAQTVSSEGGNFIRFIESCNSGGLIKKNAQLKSISKEFLYSLHTSTNIKAYDLDNLKKIFNTGYPGIFDADVIKLDIPTIVDKKGLLGKRLENILKSSLTRDDLVSIITILETAYEDGELDLGAWAYFNLALNTRVRSGSLQLASISDLHYKMKTDEYFINLTPEKHNIDKAQKSAFKLSNSVGKILRKQRSEVLKLRAPNGISRDDAHKMALFPGRSSKSGLLISQASREHFGFVMHQSNFYQIYLKTINTILKDRKVSTNIFRHSMGSHLASMGMSAKTIRAVLRHVGDRTCQAYIDLHFQGNIDKLNSALLPAFEKHFPVFKEFSTLADYENRANLIINDDLESGEEVIEGACGANILCKHAPFACYSCKKFIPFFDANHELNFNIIQSKIDQFHKMGHAFSDSIETLRSTQKFITLTIQACNSYKERLV